MWFVGVFKGWARGDGKGDEGGGADVRYNACGSEMVCMKSNNKVSMFGNAS